MVIFMIKPQIKGVVQQCAKFQKSAIFWGGIILPNWNYVQMSNNIDFIYISSNIALFFHFNKNVHGIIFREACLCLEMILFRKYYIGTYEKFLCICKLYLYVKYLNLELFFAQPSFKKLVVKKRADRMSFIILTYKFIF